MSREQHNMSKRIAEERMSIERLRRGQLVGNQQVSGTNNHLYLSNRGTYTHAQLDALYPVAYSAQSVAGIALTEAYSAFSIASAHIAATASFHGFSVASHDYGILYDNGTNYTELAPGTASYVLTQGANSPYWKAPTAGDNTGEILSPVHTFIYAGFLESQDVAPCWYAPNADTNASIMCGFWVAAAGSFKVLFAYMDDVAAANCNAHLSISALASGEATSFNIVTDADIALNNAAANTQYTVLSNAYNLGADEMVGVYFVKTDNGNGQANNLRINGIWLVRQ